MTHVDPIVRPATTDDAPALAELFWQIRQECVPQERHGFNQVHWTDGDNDEAAPDVLMVWPGTAPTP